MLLEVHHITHVVQAYAALQSAILPPTLTTQAPGITSDDWEGPGAAACNSVDYFLSYCQEVNGGFDDAARWNVAHCFCYSKTVWMPGVFDGAVRTCLNYASKSLPTPAYNEMQRLDDFCHNMGPHGPNDKPPEHDEEPDAEADAEAEIDPENPDATVTAKPTSTSTADIFENKGCWTVAEYLEYCEKVFPDFSVAPRSSQAPCLCYSHTRWMPQVFDDAIETCSEYIYTAAPNSLSLFEALKGFCAEAGDVYKHGGVNPGSGDIRTAAPGEMDDNGSDPDMSPMHLMKRLNALFPKPAQHHPGPLPTIRRP